MTLQAWSFGRVWVAISVGLWILSALAGAVYIEPRFKRVAAFFETEGPSSAEGRAMLDLLAARGLSEPRQYRLTLGIASLYVGNVNSSPIEDRSGIDRAAYERDGVLADRAEGDRTVMSDEEEAVAVPAVDGRVKRLAEVSGALGHGVVHWLEIRRRRADDPQDLGGGRLMLLRIRLIP